jgi:hypothetical protein
MLALHDRGRCLGFTTEKPIIRTFVACLFLVVATTFHSASSKATERICCDQQPGHPTTAEKESFGDEILHMVPDAENKHSDTISSDQNLYRLSQAPKAPDVSKVIRDDIAYAEHKIVPWNSTHCDPPRLDYPRWEGYPVTRCPYSDIGVTVHTYMLNADRAKQARWIVIACQDAKAPNMHACIDYMVRVVRKASSGGVFPVAGYIPEPEGGNVCYVFRDGVTVWTALRPYWQHPKNNSCGGDGDEMEAPLHKAWKFARIASTTRPEYKNAGGTLPFDDLHWVDVTRTLYQMAWTSDRNELMSATAIQARRDHRF